MPGEIFVNLAMAGNWLAHLGFRVLIPIMVTTMSDQLRAQFFDFLDEVALLHATSNSACRRT